MDLEHLGRGGEPARDRGARSLPAGRPAAAGCAGRAGSASHHAPSRTGRRHCPTRRSARPAPACRRAGRRRTGRHGRSAPWWSNGGRGRSPARAGAAGTASPACCRRAPARRRLGLRRAGGDVGEAQQRVARRLDPDQGRLAARAPRRKRHRRAWSTKSAASCPLLLEAARAAGRCRHSNRAARRTRAPAGSSSKASKAADWPLLVTAPPAAPSSSASSSASMVAIGVDRARIIIVRLGVGVGPAESVGGPQRRRDAAIGRIGVGPGGRG